MTCDMKPVYISHNQVNVTYYSASNEEIDAIKNCFGYYWAVKNSSSIDEGWTVISKQVSSIKDIVDLNKLTLSAGLFKYAPVKKMVIGKKHYYVHDIQKYDCLTCFDLENKTTYFYHEHIINDYSYIRNLVREPIVAQYQELRYVTLHASACSINDKGILMPGPKGAGKSTLMIHLLENGANFIGNDGVLCKRENNSIVLTAIPQSVRLTKETIRNSRILSDYFGDKVHCDFINDKIEFLPYLYDRIFAKHHLSFISKLELIIIPLIDLSRTDYTIEIIENDMNLELLQESLFGKYHNYIWSPFFHKQNDPLVDTYNFSIVFKSIPKICYLKYGILDYYNQKKMYNDILNIM